ncbi:MAG: ATP-dependent Clp protease adaptor ClpS [Saprospiraceae bacterium]|nr:ATP-dependent Clp protease adaptor ClpS [Saprospiraceae bacterium]
MNFYYDDPDEVMVEEEIDLEEELSGISTGTPAYLIVHNDNFNTFDWVIDCFIDVLQHSADQAEQLAYIIHHKGKATVKTATLSELKPKKDALCDRGLAAVIEGGKESNP